MFFRPLTVEIGKSYEISFYLYYFCDASQPDCLDAQDQIELTLDNQVVQTYDYAALGDTFTWTRKIYIFTASSITSRVSFFFYY